MSSGSFVLCLLCDDSFWRGDGQRRRTGKLTKATTSGNEFLHFAQGSVVSHLAVFQVLSVAAPHHCTRGQHPFPAIFASISSPPIDFFVSSPLLTCLEIYGIHRDTIYTQGVRSLRGTAPGGNGVVSCLSCRKSLARAHRVTATVTGTVSSVNKAACS